MVKLYVKSIIKGRIKFSEVPATYKEEVKEGLKGEVTKGTISEEQLKKFLEG